MSSGVGGGLILSGCSNCGGGICSSDKYTILLYCLTVQAGFYSNIIECWPVMQAAGV